MLGDASCRIALQVLGYAWPAYKCYKEMGGVQAGGASDALLKWCKYWVIMALFTAVSPFADTFIFWLPFYYEVKLAFPIYLWWNNLAGAEHVYRTYLQPFISQREPLLDSKIAEARALAGDYASSGLARGLQLLQTRMFAALLALQSGQAPVQPQPAASPLKERNGEENLERRSSSFSLDRFLSARSSSIKAYPVAAEGKGE